MEDRHLKWIYARKSSALFDFIKPQKQLKKYKKVNRVKERIKKLRELDIDDLSLLYEGIDDSDDREDG